jgi:hypothetical protein
MNTDYLSAALVAQHDDNIITPYLLFLAIFIRK